MIHEERLEKNQTHINDYPLFEDPQFYQKIFRKKEFFDNRYKSEWWEEWKNASLEPFKNLPHQQLCYTLFGPHTPYYGIYLFHGMGSGKTNCATQIVEGNKLFLDEHNSMALILVPNELIMSSMIYELLGKEVMPDGSIRFKKKTTGDKYIDEKLRNSLNNINSHQHTNLCPDDCDKKQQIKIRKIVNYIKKEKLLKYYEIETHQRFAKIIEETSEQEINRLLSNRIIVVDEIHKIRNQTTLYKSLKKTINNTHNTKFIFMSGTPCVDRETEIQPIINLLRENDGKEDLIKEKDIRQLFHNNPNIRKQAETTFGQKVKGYISFIRGMNPITFPIKIEMGTRFFPDVNFNTINCFMKGKQLIKYLSAFFDEFNPNVEANVTNELWEKSRCASRCAFEGTKDEEWKYDVVHNISCKFSKMWEMFKLSEGQGAILIYAFNIDKGINLVEKFLRLNGISPFTIENATEKTPKYVNFSNIANSELKQRALDICKSHENYKGEYIKFILGTGKIRTGITFKHLSQAHVFETDWNIPTTEQTIFRGARQFSHHHPQYDDTNRNILTFRYRSIVSPNDVDELPKQFKQRYHNFINRYQDQLTKRGFLNENKKRKLNNTTTTTTTTTTTDTKVTPTKRLLSIDDFMYKTCLSKDIPANRVERLSKIYAFDNPLQINANYFPGIEDHRFEGSRIANYDKLEYECPIPDEHHLTKVSNVKEPSPEEIDSSTHDLIDWVILINDTKNTIQYIQHDQFDAIIEMFQFRLAWKFIELKAVFKISFPNVRASDRTLAYILNWMVQTKYRFKIDENYDGQEKEGFIVYAKDVYTFVFLNKIIQTGICDVMDIAQLEHNIPNNFETKYFSIHQHLEYDNVFKDIFGKVTLINDINKLHIPMYINQELFDVNSSLVITLKDTEKWCGVVDNTKDNPNTFELKLWKGTKTIAASSKKLSDLRKICDSLNIENSNVDKKNGLCITMKKSMIKQNIILPWAPTKIPSLHRIYIVAKKWNIQNIVNTIDGIVKEILDNKGKLFVDAAFEIIQLRQKNILNDCPDIRDILVNHFSKYVNVEKTEYVLCLLQRMYGARPTRIKNDTEWNIIQKIYNEQFYEVYKTHIADICKKINQFMKCHPQPQPQSQPQLQLQPQSQLQQLVDWIDEKDDNLQNKRHKTE